MVFWAPFLHPDNPISPFSTGFIINDDSGLQMEYQTGAGSAFRELDSSFITGRSTASPVSSCRNRGSENVQVTYREPSSGFPDGQEDNVKLRAYAPRFESAGPGEVASLVVGRSAAPLQLDLFWGSSCSAGAADYAVYEGTLTSLRAGSYDHAPVHCSDQAPFLQETIVPANQDTYFLIVPLAASAEGSHGYAWDGTTLSERPNGASQCRTVQELGCP